MQANSVTVFEAFDPEILKRIPNKLCSLSVTSSIDQINQLDTTYFKTMLTSNQIDKWFWLTYEEFLKILDAGWGVPLLGSKKITIIKNNLYLELYPLSSPFPQVDQAFELLSQQNDEVLPDEQADLANLFFSFYDQIEKMNGVYFVKSAERPESKQLDIRSIPLWEETIVDQITVIPQKIELPIDFNLESDEAAFQTFLTQAIEQQVHHLRVAYTQAKLKDSVIENRLQQLKILACLLNIPEILILQQTLSKKAIIHIEDYRKILQDNWQYPDFRNLKMYANPESRSNEITEVSQARIIDDIVEQAEVALRNQVPRDIFITASTGAGKSVMFQVPALYLLSRYAEQRPLTIIISPLIGLMNDQVKGMQRKGITNAKTINSALAPSEKEDTIEQVKNGQIDLLYLSPETLQNRNDITQIIGERRIGLLIVDEAHTVVTWGKSFRADYWYLGLYLQKLRKTQYFPIVTFTATATIGGENDMFREIRNSLNMINPICYIGYVKRDDIMMQVTHMPKQKQRGLNTVDLKATLLLKRLRIWKKENKKMLVYFPTVKLLNLVLRTMEEYPAIGNQCRAYYGSMTASDKNNSYEDFINGNALFMFATKAFGMGIDISDIAGVYHYAPTGDVVDYIQEIGRVARDHKLVEKGQAIFDYFDSDFKYVKQLHGMSTIRPWQLKEAMKKILELYKLNKYNRNLVISAEDFKYVLELKDDEVGQADNKLKIILLMLEKDFAQAGNYHYAPFVARPKQVFGKELVFINSENLNKIKRSRIKNYVELVRQSQDKSEFPAVYLFDMASYWHKFHKTDSYPKFKFEVFNRKERAAHTELKVFDLLDFATQITVSWTDFDGLSKTKGQAQQVVHCFKTYLSQFAYTEKQFSINDLAKYLMKNIATIRSQTSAATIVASLINLCLSYGKMEHNTVIVPRVSGQSDRFKVLKTFTNFFDYIQSLERQLYETHPNRFFDQKNMCLTMYYRRDFSKQANNKLELMLAYVGFLESLGLVTFTTISGGDAQIYVRINNTRRMEQAIKNPNYVNHILAKIQKDYRQNVAMLDYLFRYEQNGMDDVEKNSNYTDFFWNSIESFFLGTIPSAVIKQADLNK